MRTYPHSNWPDTWSPYRQRDTCTPLLDDKTFNILLDVGASRTGHSAVLPSLFMTGCLDAPLEIPCGSTQCIRTVGGYEREEYTRMPRGVDDWKARARAETEVAKWLAEILSEVD